MEIKPPIVPKCAANEAIAELKQMLATNMRIEAVKTSFITELTRLYYQQLINERRNTANGYRTMTISLAIASFLLSSAIIIIITALTK